MFIKTYKQNYPREPLPPSQMALETLSLGKLARLYKALSTNELKLGIAAEFHLPPVILETWLIWLTNVRNVCAHHGRLWNRIMSADRPLMPSRKAFKFAIPMPENANTTMYGAVALIHRLLTSCNPGNSFTNKVEALIEKYGVDARSMGFPADWKRTAVWHYE